jgi:hypothetical protein
VKNGSANIVGQPNAGDRADHSTGESHKGDLKTEESRDRRAPDELRDVASGKRVLRVGSRAPPHGRRVGVCGARPGRTPLPVGE